MGRLNTDSERKRPKVCQLRVFCSDHILALFQQFAEKDVKMVELVLVAILVPVQKTSLAGHVRHVCVLPYISGLIAILTTESTPLLWHLN